MKLAKTLILDKDRINRKLERMAYEIWEHHSTEENIMLIGVEHGGMVIAKILAEIVDRISNMNVTVVPLRINKKHPVQDNVRLDVPLDQKSIVLIDDVANSGRTLLYALKPLLYGMPRKITIAVLVDRQHKSFPIACDIVGHTVATTIHEHICVEIEGNEVVAAYLTDKDPPEA